METEARSTLTYRSNLQPLDETLQGKLCFEQSVRDPFALEILKRNGISLTDIQKQEYQYASVHCAYAAIDDYPWGTIRFEDGTEQVACKCLNVGCLHFRECRPDFIESELLILEENKKVLGKATSFFKTVTIKPVRNEDFYDKKAIQSVFKRDKSVDNRVSLTETKNDLLTIPTTPPLMPELSIVKKTPAAKSSDTTEDVGFESFAEARQEDVIKSPLAERIMVNAGPGTGKTWTLIEKLVYILRNQEADPEGILILCFSRAAVEVIEQRLRAAADAGRIDYDWGRIDIRTFDSFATYVIAWVQENHTDLLPKDYLLEAQDYDARIGTAIDILKKKEDILSRYEHLIIDEVQDLVGCRSELVLKLISILPEECGFTLFGDACQALYDWQSSEDPSIMTSDEFYRRIFKAYPRVSYLSFKENHRQEDNLSLLAVPYREAILTGNTSDRISIANEIYRTIGSSEINLQHVQQKDIESFIKNGTLGILTRTNGQALRISTWLKNAGIKHNLLRTASDVFLGDWIARVFKKYSNETINEEMFAQVFISIYPQASNETAQEYWNALIATQYATQKSRYDVEDLLKGLLLNGKSKLLYTHSDSEGAIVVSNVHRAKGREFDSVLVIDDVISSVQGEDKDNLQEHKVCYVALTRPRKQLSGIGLKNQYIYIDKIGNRRCFQAGGFKNRKYLSHIEIGFVSDLEKNAFAAEPATQTFISSVLEENTRLKLKKCPEGFASYITYKVVLEENENMLLGYTGKPFADGIKRAIQRIFETGRNIDYKYYPNIFGDIYVDKLVTFISAAGRGLKGARLFGDIGIWMGFSVMGFAQMEKDRY